jgi:hypothetical protein
MADTEPRVMFVRSGTAYPSGTQSANVNVGSRTNRANVENTPAYYIKL